MFSRWDLDMFRAEEQCWPDDEALQWECPVCGHLNEHDGSMCDGCEGETR
jgi:hypothetical protein